MAHPLPNPQFHLYEIHRLATIYWIVAPSITEAEQVVHADDFDIDSDELDVYPIPDETPWPITYVDGFDNGNSTPTADEIPPNAHWTHDAHGYAVVTVTAGTWAQWVGRSIMIDCA